ncbi:MAG: tRNA 2-selenouridine(34) synthase MnmH [Burkholderiaceae bacterium]
MAAPLVLPANEALAQLGGFSAIIDARSQAEYALDHVPGAVNWPVLDNDERAEVGTLYKQVNPFSARKRGAALVAANIARHITAHLQDAPRGWQPLVYCWRGGQRSGSLALVLGQIGFKVTLVEGGYKAYRAEVVAQIPALAQALSFRVICGPTGCGKTRLLHALAAAGAQVLDLEALASHRSSVLGLIPGQPQPSQKHFDTLVWQALRCFNPVRPVYVEAESKKVGNLAIPDALMQAMRASPCLDLQLSDDERVQLLLEDYDFLRRDTALFAQRLDILTELRGKATVDVWQMQIACGQIEAVVRDLLLVHYDPGYAQSIKRNFSLYPEAQALLPVDRSAASMAQLAGNLLQRPGKAD